MSDVWTTNSGYTLTINARGNTVTKNFSSPITAENVKAAAREVGISQFTVYNDMNGMLEGTAFPYSGNVMIREYNAAKNIE